MKNILLITTTYRTGEKIYPIIPELSQYFNIDILHMFKMSNNTDIPKDTDYRYFFKRKYNSYIRNEYHGPAFTRDHKYNVEESVGFAYNFEGVVRNNNYSMVIWDNNIPSKGGAVRHFYSLFCKYNIPVFGSPHGNRDFPGYKLSKRFERCYDYSFVFGDYEKLRISKCKKGSKFNQQEINERCVSAGIPSNDFLKGYKRGNDYILVIPNFTERRPRGSLTGTFKALDARFFNNIRVMDVAEHFGVPVVIKKKMREFCQEDLFDKQMAKYGCDVKIINHCEDDNKLISNAKVVIGAPSTLMFKPIQMGIPTVLFNGHGMIGNFRIYDSLINDVSYKNIMSSIKKQIDNGKSNDFINKVLAGGLNFESTGLYVDYIREFLR